MSKLIYFFPNNITSANSTPSKYYTFKLFIQRFLYKIAYDKKYSLANIKEPVVSIIFEIMRKNIYEKMLNLKCIYIDKTKNSK
jgi:hypothetical protein